jgi:aspartate/methionine/tyrosine aminotransferase
VRISERGQGFTEPVIREMTRVVSRYDSAFALWLIEDVGVATVPGSSFCAHPELGRTTIRFCFPKTDDVLIDAGERLQKFRQLAG